MPEDRHPAVSIEFRDVTKLYPGADRAGGRQALARGPGGRDLRARRPVGLRQDHRDADGQPPDRHHRAATSSRRQERQGAQAGRAAPRDRLRDPADRPVPAPDRRRQHRDGPEAARLGQGAHPRARRRAARAHLARPRRGPRPLPRRSCRAASASASASPAPSPPTRRCCSWTSRSARSTRSTASACRTSSCACRREIRKTIVFVTHDIDEAIKMGDKIAVLKKGGHLAQYAAPAELLMQPGRRVRRGLRRRRPRAQAPRAAARRATSTCGRPRSCKAGEPVAEVRAQDRRRRPRHPAARRRRTAARRAGCASAG